MTSLTPQNKKDLAEKAEIGLSLVDCLSVVLGCTLSQAAILADDQATREIWEIGRSRGKAKLLTVMMRLGANGNASAARLALGHRQEDEQERRDDSWKNGPVLDIGSSVRKFIAEQAQFLADNEFKASDHD